MRDVVSFCLDRDEFIHDQNNVQVDERLIKWNFDKVPPVCDYADDPYTMDKPKYHYIQTDEINWKEIGLLDFKLEKQTYDVKERFVSKFVECGTNSRILHIGGVHDPKLYIDFVYYLNSLDPIGDIVIEIILKGYPMQIERGFDLYQPYNLKPTSKLKSIRNFSHTIQAISQKPIDMDKYNVIYQMAISAPCSVAFGNNDPDWLDQVKKNKWTIEKLN